VKILENALLRGCILSAVALAAAAPANAYVIAGDTFRVSLTGQWQGGSATLFNLETTLGTTQTFTGAGYEGQDITISSSVTTVAGNTAINVNLSTPQDFMLTAKAGFPAFVVGYVLNLGGTGAQVNPIDFDSAPTVLGKWGGWNNGSEALIGGGVTGNSFAGSFSYTTGSYGIPATNNNINSAFYSVLIAGAPSEVPEPAMLGLFGLGALSIGLTRRKARA
jgi:hypothetical protein